MKNKITVGTCHFVSIFDARRYFSYEGSKIAAERAVTTKLKEGSIKIGPPEIKKGQKLLINKDEGRYFIES